MRRKLSGVKVGALAVCFVALSGAPKAGEGERFSDNPFSGMPDVPLSIAESSPGCFAVKRSDERPMAIVGYDLSRLDGPERQLTQCVVHIFYADGGPGKVENVPKEFQAATEAFPFGAMKRYRRQGSDAAYAFVRASQIFGKEKRFCPFEAYEGFNRASLDTTGLPLVACKDADPRPGRTYGLLLFMYKRQDRSAMTSVDDLGLGAIIFTIGRDGKITRDR